MGDILKFSLPKYETNKKSHGTQTFNRQLAKAIVMQVMNALRTY